MAGRETIDESEVDGGGDDAETVATCAHDHFAFQVESISAHFYSAKQVCRIQTESALRVGDTGLRRPGDRPRGETIGQPPPRQHLIEEMRAATDDQIAAGLS